MRSFYIFFFIYICFFILATPALAAQPLYQPGFKTYGLFREEPEFRLDLNIWYPAARAPHELNFSPWILNASLNAKCANGKFPLLILSHPSPGSRFSYHELAAALAVNGFVVAAPTHTHDNMDNMDDFFTWRQMERRAEEIRETIALLPAMPDIGANVDAAKIGLIGFGAGGATALLLGGAQPNCGNWSHYCGRADSADPYCTKWAKEKISAICDSFPLAQSLADPTIKAMAVVAPAFGMFFDNASFADFQTPVLIIGAGNDNFNKIERHSEPIARILGKKANYLELNGADTGALMSKCPPLFESEMPELCLSVTPAQRQKLFKRLSASLLAFFSSQFGGRNLGSPPLPSGNGGN